MDMSRRRVRRIMRDTEGVGMIEVAVAIIVLGVVLVGFLPLLMNSVIFAAQNQKIGEANRLVSSQIGVQRGMLEGGCTATPGTDPVRVSGIGGEGLEVRQRITCDTTQNLATLTVQVRSTKNNAVLSEATTQVWKR